MNNLKTTFLLVLLTLLLIFAGNLIGGRGGAMIAFVIAMGMNFISYWFSDKIVLAMYRAKEVTENEAPALYTAVRMLVTRANLPMPKVYIMENPTPNAFATGRNPEHAAVAVTTGILDILSKDELAGVLAHELAHVQHRDILISTIAAAIAGAISMLANMAQWSMMFGGRDDRDGRGNIVASLALIILAPIAAMLVQMAVSRSREFEADKGGAIISGSPLSLANALRKLDRGVHQIPMDANPATAHMFIVSPLTGNAFFKLFSTHPPIEERIARLEQMALNPY
ncbi:MAG: zinc metalloprotease HtpX [Nitrospirae bacterium]|nr:zinc metalloprotease HtpX [Nitrospirota bacterium]MBI3604711.1 zinc metalloprotease HtpX [Nitrospirota bacterium]